MYSPAKRGSKPGVFNKGKSKNNPSKKKKWLTIGGVVIIVLALLYFFGPSPMSIVMDTVGPPPEDPKARVAWLSNNIDNIDHDKFVVLDAKLPTWKELDAMHAALPVKENYPKHINAIQTYGTMPNLVEAMYFGDVLKDTGINTQFIHTNHWYKGGELKLWYQGYDEPSTLNQDESKRAIVHNILLAKQQGLAVILFPDYVDLEDGGMNRLGITTDLEERLETIALDLAVIAEKYDVEYLVPSNQIEMILHSNDYSVEEAQIRTNSFYASAVPKIRAIYSGKILYKMGGFGDWDNYDKISLKGADIFGFTGCYNRRAQTLGFVTQDIKDSAAKASGLSNIYGIPWINAEFLVDDNTTIPPTSYGERPTTILPIEDYYEAGLAAFNKYGATSSGFTVHSMLGAGKVYDTPAMPMIKKFFTSKQ